MVDRSIVRALLSVVLFCIFGGLAGYLITTLSLTELHETEMFGDSEIDPVPIYQESSYLAPEAREYCLGQGYDYDALVSERDWDACLIDYWKGDRIRLHPEVVQYLRYRDGNCSPDTEACALMETIQNPPSGDWWDAVILSDPARSGGAPQGGDL